jgi:hypothetical protein
MWDPTNANQSHKFVEDILDKDYEMSIRINEKRMQVKEVYELFQQRLELLDKSLSLPLNESDKTMLSYKRAEICMDLKMFKLKRDTIGLFNELTNRIEKIESELLGK